MKPKELKNKSLSLKVEKIPLDELEDWNLDENFNLKHKSSGFFTYTAIRQNNYKNIFSKPLLLQNGFEQLHKRV